MKVNGKNKLCGNWGFWIIKGCCQWFCVQEMILVLYYLFLSLFKGLYVLLQSVVVMYMFVLVIYIVICNENYVEDVIVYNLKK